MILEAQQIYESLVDSDWSPSLKHEDLYRPGKTDAIRVELSCDGKRVSSIHIVDKETVSNYWTIGDDNKNRFPVSNIELPESCKKIKTAKAIEEWANKNSSEKQQQLKTWIQDDFPQEKLGELSLSFKKRLHKRSEELARIAETSAANFLNLLELFAECSEEQYQNWLKEILEILKSMSLQDGKDSKVAQKLLVALIYTARPQKGSRENNKAAIKVIWDLEKKELNEYQASSPSHYKTINAALLDSEKPDNSNELTQRQCAITLRKDIEEKSFPNPGLQHLGPSRLYARNKASKSFGRYGKFGSDAFPLSRSHSLRLEAAITSLIASERENKTWTKIIGEKWEKGSKTSIPSQDLLIVYQASLADQNFASALGTEQHFIGEASFEELCKRLIERTKGNATNQLRGKILIAVVRKVDKSNRKIVFHSTINVDSLEKSAHLWQDACKAFPGLKLNIPTEKGKPASLMSPPVLSPGSLPALTKTFHFLDGSTSDSPGGITFPDAMHLLLTMQNPDPKLVKRCLSITIRRLGPLLQRTAFTKHRSTGNSKSDFFKMKGDRKWNILKVQSLFSVLLISSNRTPNIVMNSIAYQLGQLCAAYDLIHVGYCYDERRGDLPPKLLGNVCFQSANRNPTAALSQLSQRAAPHLAWVNRARNVETPEDERTEEEWAIIKARSAAKKIKSHSARIHQALLRNEASIDDLFRAELLLGYLAGFPKED